MVREVGRRTGSRGHHLPAAGIGPVPRPGRDGGWGVRPPSGSDAAARSGAGSVPYTAEPKNGMPSPGGL